jgi:hypothetical protein
MNGKLVSKYLCIFLAIALLKVQAANLQIITLDEPPVTGFSQGDADSPGPFIVGIVKTSE